MKAAVNGAYMSISSSIYADRFMQYKITVDVELDISGVKVK